MQSETYDIRYTPHLGKDEEAYMLLFYFGGFDTCRAPMAKKVINTEEDYSFRITVYYPPGIIRGRTKLPSDTALMCIAVIRSNSDDDPHLRHHGAEEAGTAAIPLKGLVEADTKLIFHNAVRLYKGIDFTKGILHVKAVSPIPDRDFKKPNKLSVTHNANLQNKPLLVAAIIGQQFYATQTPTINREAYKDVNKIPCMPPWEFHTMVLPGFMLSSGKNTEPHDHDWWQSLIQMGVTRTNPTVSGKAAAKYLLEEVHDDRSIAAIAVAACAVPTNYWRYGSDETEVDSEEFATENYTVLSRFKLGEITEKDKHGNLKKRYVTPKDDCENDGDDIRMLVRELQTMPVNSKTHPVLGKVQAALQNYVVVQSLTAVHGAKEEDGTASDGQASIGLHSMTDLLPKQLFATAHGRINSARPLFKGWMEDVNPDSSVDAKLHIPIDGEGTGLVDPLGNDSRNKLGPAYSSLFGSNAEGLGDLKIVMPSSPGRKGVHDKFYVSKVSLVVPELIETNYGSCMFTPVTMKTKNTVERMVTQEDFMECSEKFGLRVEPSITAEQAQIIKHVNSFYPPMGKFEPPEPLETSEVRQRLQRKMNKITETVATCNRAVKDSSKLATADLYAAYYQITGKHVATICNAIKTNPAIVDVTVEEEPVARYLGGYRIAFKIDTSVQQQSKQK